MNIEDLPSKLQSEFDRKFQIERPGHGVSAGRGRALQGMINERHRKLSPLLNFDGIARPEPVLMLLGELELLRACL